MVTSQPVSLTTYTQMGWTPLIIAALYGQCEVVTELLSRGADVNGQNDVSYINTTYSVSPSIITTGRSAQFGQGVVRVGTCAHTRASHCPIGIRMP